MNENYNQLKFGETKRRRRGVYLKCYTCGKKFYVPPCRLKIGVVRYCSQKCRKKSGYNNPFYGKKHTKESINKMLNHPNRHSFGKDSNNPNYVRFGENYKGKTKQWWSRYLIRKYGKCKLCGFDDKRILIIHHKDRNTKNNTENNLLLICPNCHSIIHYKTKTGMYNKKVEGCIISECKNIHFGKGYCQKHYLRIWKKNKKEKK